jgi:ABC-type branched-subunit amino acid transport system permease subunit
MRNIQSIGQLKELQNETFVYAAIVALLIFVVALVLANLTAYKGGIDRSYITRRIWLIVSVVVGSLGFWLYNDIYVMSFIKKPAFQNQFSDTNMQCLGITVLGSLIISFIVMLVFRHSKFGSILGKEKNS